MPVPAPSCTFCGRGQLSSDSVLFGLSPAGRGPRPVTASSSSLPPTEQVKRELLKAQGPAQGHRVPELRFEAPSPSLPFQALPSTWCCLPGRLERHLSLGLCLRGLPGQPAKAATRNFCPFSHPWIPASRPRQPGESGSTLLVCSDVQVKEAVLTGTVLGLGWSTLAGPPPGPGFPAWRNSRPSFMEGLWART